MKYVRIIENYNHLWAVKSKNNEEDELTELFVKWNNVDTENLDELFKLLDVTDTRASELSRVKLEIGIGRGMRVG